jgi:hypothetical protein
MSCCEARRKSDQETPNRKRIDSVVASLTTKLRDRRTVSDKGVMLIAWIVLATVLTACLLEEPLYLLIACLLCPVVLTTHWGESLSDIFDQFWREEEPMAAGPLAVCYQQESSRKPVADALKRCLARAPLMEPSEVPATERQAIQSLAMSADREMVRLAVFAIGYIGDESCLFFLKHLAARPDEIGAVARESADRLSVMLLEHRQSTRLLRAGEKPFGHDEENLLRPTRLTLTPTRQLLRSRENRSQ